LDSSKPKPAKTKSTPKDATPPNEALKKTPKAQGPKKRGPVKSLNLDSASLVKKESSHEKSPLTASSRLSPKSNKTKPKVPLSGRDLAKLVVSAADEHKVLSPVLLNLTGLSSVADWFYIASLDSSRQVKSVAEKIIQRVTEAGLKPLGQEGLSNTECRWALLDLGEVVVHLFLAETRTLYDLEGLWADAPRVNPLD
jgi:ribosome-associated protein